MKNILKRFEKTLPAHCKIRDNQGDIWIYADIVGVTKKIVDFYPKVGELLRSTYQKFPDAARSLEENQKDFLRRFTKSLNEKSKNSSVKFRHVNFGYYTGEIVEERRLI